MKKIKIITDLDPIKDGIDNLEDVMKTEDYRGIVISTTGKGRVISGEEMGEIICRLGAANETIVLGDYLACINEEKTFYIRDNRYFVGSMMIFKCGGQGNPFAAVTQDDIDSMADAFCSRIHEIRINGEAVSAFSLD